MNKICSNSKKGKDNRLISENEKLIPFVIEFKFPGDVLNDLENLCKLISIDKDEFIAEAIYEKILSYHETPEYLSEALLSSESVVTLMENIREDLNNYYLKNACLPKNYYLKSEKQTKKE